MRPGERVLLLGPSGSGKSTLLMAVAGLLDPAGAAEQEGELHVDGLLPPAARGRVGIVFQDPESQIVMGRAGDDVAFGLENLCLARDAIWPRVGAALDAVGFRHGLDRPTDALSGGEQQRLAIAGTLAMRPGILLLDEPTANLDPVGAAAVREVLAGVLGQLGITMVLVEHRVSEALPLIERVLVLRAGAGVVADGSPREVFARHGDALADSGVWVPDRRLPAPPRRPRATAESQIVAEQVTYAYPGIRRNAVERVDVQVRSAEALAVTGPNGAGKSTLALLLAGLLQPTGGTVYATEALARGRGHDAIWRWDARELARHVGMVFQDPEHQFLARTVRQELMIGPLRVGVEPSVARRRADELLERLHLSALAEANPFTLSGGEKRRLSVATALATAPSVLLLDEPTFGQDRRTATELLHLLAALRDDGRAVVFATHDREFAAALADRTLHIGPGGRPR